MGKTIRKYRELPFEQKTAIKTAVGLCFSAALALGKLTIGLFTDYNLISIAVYTFGLLLAKFESLLGVKGGSKSFKRRNGLTAAFLFLSSVLYVGFMSRLFFIELEIESGGMVSVLLLAFISFCELGFAIAGLIRTKGRGQFLRNFKIVNFCAALIAILTTQIAILDMQLKTNAVNTANACSGIGVGCVIALCAVYILIAPKTSVTGREYSKFVLKEADRNRLINLRDKKTEIVLCRSVVYGDFLFRAEIEGDTVEGEIGRGLSLWKRMAVPFKIVCCLLSELLVFVWLAGRGILFVRSACLPQRLERRMRENGFVCVAVGSPPKARRT